MSYTEYSLEHLDKVNDIDDLERKMKSLIFGKNLSVDPMERKYIMFLF